MLFMPRTWFSHVCVTPDFLDEWQIEQWPTMPERMVGFWAPLDAVNPRFKSAHICTDDECNVGHDVATHVVLFGYSD